MRSVSSAELKRNPRGVLAMAETEAVSITRYGRAFVVLVSWVVYAALSGSYEHAAAACTSPVSDNDID